MFGRYLTKVLPAGPCMAACADGGGADTDDEPNETGNDASAAPPGSQPTPPPVGQASLIPSGRASLPPTAAPPNVPSAPPSNDGTIGGCHEGDARGGDGPPCPDLIVRVEELRNVRVTPRGNYEGPIEFTVHLVGQAHDLSASSRYEFVAPPNQAQGCAALGQADCSALQGRCADIIDSAVSSPEFEGGSADVENRVQFGDEGTDVRARKTVRLEPVPMESSTPLFWVLDPAAHGDFVPVILENVRVLEGLDRVCVRA